MADPFWFWWTHANKRVGRVSERLLPETPDGGAEEYSGEQLVTPFGGVVEDTTRKGDVGNNV